MRLLVLALVLLLPGLARAHKPSDAQLGLEVTDRQITGRLDLSLRDLEHAIGLDADADGALTWLEVRRASPAIVAYVQDRLQLRATGPCPLIVRPPRGLAEHVDGAYAVVELAATCPGVPRELHIDYRLLLDVDAQHRGLLSLRHAGHVQTAVLAGPARLELAAPSVLASFTAFIREGVWHIWIGFDHILFLLALLLPAVVSGGRFRAVLIEVLEVVTAFTLAHSITLIIAALGLFRLPSRFVETAIALSVALAALNNLWRVVQARWAVAFGLGLLHGFGFSSVLLDLGLPASALVPALLGFNFGVELGQAAIVAVFLPVAYALRRTLFYRIVLVAGSAAILVIALRWSFERMTS